MVPAAILLVACSSTVSAPSPTAAASPTPLPTRSASPMQVPIAQSDALVSMRMTSLSIMWAATNKRVLRSTDAGRHWTDVTPPYGGHDWAAFFAVDDAAAWVVQSDFDSSLYTVWRTVDAGASWRSFASGLLGGSVTSVMFVDRMHGWITDSLGSAAGSEGVAILRSTDGGATWSVTASTDDPSTGQGSSGIQFGCDKGAAVFGSPSIGLLTTFCAGGPPFIYRTTDGGFTWRGQALPNVPSTQYGGGAENATFLSPTDAIVTTEYYADGPVYGLLVTLDGGATWSAHRLPGAGSVDFESILSGWQLNDTLAATSDGGSTWHTIGSSLPFNATDMTLQFLGKGIAVAWAFRQATAYRTDDAGKTWRWVVPSGLGT